MQSVPDDLTCCRGALLEDVSKNLLRAANQFQITKRPPSINELIGDDDKAKRTTYCGKVYCEGKDRQNINITTREYLE